MVPEIISIDLETTGFSPKKHRIFEIGAVSSHGAEFQIFIKVQVPSFIQKLTNVTQEQVDKGVTLKEACEKFAAWLSQRESGAVWAGHRIRTFDFRFLLYAFKEAGFSRPVYPKGGIVDTFEFATKKKLQSKKLGAVYLLATGKELEGAHRATQDAKAVLEILFSDWAQMEWWPTSVRKCL